MTPISGTKNFPISIQPDSDSDSDYESDNEPSSPVNEDRKTQMVDLLSDSPTVCREPMLTTRAEGCSRGNVDVDRVSEQLCEVRGPQYDG